MQNIKTRKLTAWIAAIAILGVMLFSTIFISQHIEHECTGEECPVCAFMVQCENNINSIGAMIVIVLAAFFLGLSILKSMQHIITTYSKYSLISQKVRLNI